MSQEKYIGMDVHQASISVAVMDAQGKLIMESLLETKASTIIEFIQGLQGTLSLTFEEGTSAAWLHDLLKPHVSRLVVCDPRKTALLKEGNKSDRIDARKLAESLRTNQLHSVYHEEHGIRTLKELGRSYLTITKDVTRVMNRIKSLYRSWAIPCSGATVYAPRHRAEWLAKIMEPGVRIRAAHLYEQLDGLQPLRLLARGELLRESQKHPAVKLLRQIPSIGPIRAALLVALLQTPHRFRTKRQLLFIELIENPARPLLVQVNEFYKKGCQEKSSASTGGRGSFSRSSPFCVVPLKRFGSLSILVSVSLLRVAKFECKRRGKQDEVNHGSIRGSWPIAISGDPGGHSV